MMNMKACKNGKKGAWHLLGFALLMAGCAATVGGPEGGPGGGGLGTVRVEVSGLGVSAQPKLLAERQGPQRTAYPSLPEGTLTYTYTWEKTPGGAVEPELDGDGKFILAVGNYTLAVKAYLDADHTELVGTGVGKVGDNTTIPVTNGGNQTVTVKLKPVDGTDPETETVTGTLAYTITYPEGVTVISLTLQNLEGGGEPVANLTPTSTGVTTATGTTNVAAGEYLLRAKLWNDASVAGMSETVRIYGNMTTTVPGTSPDPSAASFAFATGDFTQPDPTATGDGAGGWAGGITAVREGGILKSITPTGKTAILIGRRADEPVTLNIDSDGNLQFRDPDSAGNVPIGSYAEFQLINKDNANRNGTYKQEADLDLLGNLSSKVEWTAVGTYDQYDSSTRFTGTFDGGGKAISNLYINKSGINGQGLFGSVGTGGTVQNVRIASGSVTGGIYVGGVAGENFGTITVCSNTGSVTGNWHNGGVVGENFGAITACYNSGSVTGEGQGIGGVVGWNNSGYGTITACYNIGAVSGKGQVGGVAGINDAGAITACYSTGSNSGTGNYVGGVVGWNNAAGTITACYWANFGGGGVGYNNGGTNDTTRFGGSAWPSIGGSSGQSGQWGTGDGSGSGTYWKNLGFSGTTTYPKLWWE
ncbi:hypothetical protein EZS27_022384 [termite gut metagenome]|uniref:GLUG domain-containing protein n=1 Tax=termite gut metagenome TaxID=433724 RepID=A0A5J4R4Z8_9ZZZZ